MDKGKYSFDDLNKRDVLPLDANAFVEAYARKHQDPALMAALRMYRERKVTDGYLVPTGYGKHTHFNREHQPDVIFNFQNGICKHFTPIIWIDEFNMLEPSVKIF